MKTPPEKYAKPSEVPMPNRDNHNKESFPALCMPDPPGRTKVKGVGAATKGLTFGKNG
jgi:hypothetical protein